MATASTHGCQPLFSVVRIIPPKLFYPDRQKYQNGNDTGNDNDSQS